MITLAKLKEFEQYHGFYDGFYLQKVKAGTNLTSDEEWSLLSSLLQDIKLVEKGLASKEFELRINNQISENCDNEDTIIYLKNLAKAPW